MNRSGNETEAATSTHANSATRWWVVSALAAFSLTSYLARANISVAAEVMSASLGLSKIRMGEIFSSFLAGYALFQIPAGAIGDRIGPRLTLGLSALLWSLTTALTAFLPSLFAGRLILLLTTLCIVRFALGAAEATTFPVGNLVVRNRLAPSQHATGTAVMFLGTSLASAITGPLIAHITVTYGWQSAFYLTAIPPLLLGLGWLAFAPADGAHHPRTSSTPHTTQRHAVLSILTRRRVLLLIVSYVSEGYMLFLFVFWMYTYLVERRGFSLLDAGWLAAAPWLTALVLAPLGGYLCDRIGRRRGQVQGARAVIAIGYIASGALLYVAAYAPQRWLCLVALCISIAALMGAEPGFWTYAAHVAEDHVGLVSGVMNTAGILGGIASTSLVPLLVRSFGWGVALASGTVMAFFCAIVWMFIREDRSRFVGCGDAAASSELEGRCPPATQNGGRLE
ncbi:MAG TPA: MFS transporter [Acidobacteriaceae bacterium]|jgi:ACS family glucarate transporter-like MFS transporter